MFCLLYLLSVCCYVIRKAVAGQDLETISFGSVGERN